jgi:hypothetical protein
MVEEYWDGQGNKVSACSKCQQKQNAAPLQRSDDDGLEDVTPGVDHNEDSKIDPTKPWVMAFQEAADDSMGGFIMVLPVSLKIAKYKFYFTEPGSSKVISNVAEGTVFQP